MISHARSDFGIRVAAPPLRAREGVCAPGSRGVVVGPSRYRQEHAARFAALAIAFGSLFWFGSAAGLIAYGQGLPEPIALPDRCTIEYEVVQLDVAPRALKEEWAADITTDERAATLKRAAPLRSALVLSQRAPMMFCHETVQGRRDLEKEFLVGPETTVIVGDETGSVNPGVFLASCFLTAWSRYLEGTALPATAPRPPLVACSWGTVGNSSAEPRDVRLSPIADPDRRHGWRLARPDDGYRNGCMGGVPALCRASIESWG